RAEATGEPPGDGRGAGIGTTRAGDRGERRRLAGPVGADHQKVFARRDLEAHSVDSNKAGKPFAQIGSGKKGRHGTRPLRPSNLASDGHTPDGMREMVKIRITP